MMKTLITLILLLVTTPALAINLNLGPIYSIYSNENLDSGRGLKLSADFNSPLYPWASYEETMLRFGGQEMADMKVYGGGFGIKKDGWFAELGYYLPKYELRNSYKEALWLEINRVLQPSVVPATYRPNGGNEYSYDASGGIGISLGRQISFDPFFVSIVYRWLRFRDVIQCQFPDSPHWEVYSYRDFSGVLVNLGFEWSF